MQTTPQPTSVYVEMINLERDIEKRRHMTEVLEAVGIEARMPPAFDLRQADAGALDRHTRTEGPWGRFPDQDRACTISHMRSWQRFLASDASHCLVLEDDVFVSPELGQWLSELSWWPPDADVVKLERWRGRAFKVLLQPAGTHLKRSISRLLSRHVGGAGYMLTRAAATRLVQSAPYAIAVDNLMFNQNASPVARQLVLYQVHPALVTQGNEPADKPPAAARQRIRPKGWQLVRQKLKRGYYEVAYPLGTLLKFATGKARLETIDYQAEVLS